MALIAHYKLDGNVEDAVGFDDGTPNGSVVYVNGKYGKALDYNNSNSVTITFEQEINRGNFSIAYWARGTSLPSSNFRNIFDLNDSSGNNFLKGDTRHNDSPLVFHYVKDFNINSWSTRGLISTEEYQNYNWNHYVTVFDSNTEWRSYRNGVLVGTNSITQEIEPYGNLKELHLNNTDGNSIEVQDFRIYNHRLSLREISDLAKSTVLQELIGETQDNTDNSNNFTTVKDSPSVLWNTSISFWFYPTTTARRQTLWNKGYGGEGTINFETGAELNFYSGPNGNNSGGYQAIRGGNISLNEWHHAVLIRDMDNQIFECYIDGVSVKTQSHSLTSIGETTFDLEIGTGYTNQFEGKMREVKQFASVLTADEVQKLYTEKANIDFIGNVFSNIACSVPYVSPQSVSELGWVSGNNVNDARGESDPCSGLLNYEDALAYAYAQGGRLPTIYELENDIAAGSGCGYDHELCWTCEKGDNENEHWVVPGKSSSGLVKEIRSNDQTAYVRMVAENDTNRNDPVTVNDSVIKEFLINV